MLAAAENFPERGVPTPFQPHVAGEFLCRLTSTLEADPAVDADYLSDPSLSPDQIYDEVAGVADRYLKTCTDEPEDAATNAAALAEEMIVIDTEAAERRRANRMARRRHHREAFTATNDLAEASDETLLRLMREGNVSASGTVYERYSATILRYMFFRLNDRAEAEDLTSETFIRALNRITSDDAETFDFSGPSGMESWLMTIAKNIAFDKIKSKQYRLESPAALEAYDSILGARAAISTEGAVIRLYENEELLQAINELNPTQRQVIIYRFIDQLSHGEIASMTNSSADLVKAHQYRALCRLNRMLAGRLGRTANPRLEKINKKSAADSAGEAPKEEPVAEFLASA